MRFQPPPDKSHGHITLWFVPMSGPDRFRHAAILERMAFHNAMHGKDEYTAGLHGCASRFLWGMYEATR
jgi:hypothetical protein